MTEPEDVYDESVYQQFRDAGLAPREAEAVALIEAGLTWDDAADIMGIERGTFGSKMSNEIKTKVETAFKLVSVYEDHEDAFPPVDHD